MKRCSFLHPFKSQNLTYFLICLGSSWVLDFVGQIWGHFVFHFWWTCPLSRGMYFSIFANKGDGIPPHPTSDHLLGGSLHLAPYLLLDSLFTYFFGLRNEKKKKNGANLPAVFYSKSCKYGKLTFAVIWSQFYSALCLNVSIPRTSQWHECKAWMSHWRTDFIVSCKWRVWECSLCVFKCSLVRPGLMMSDVLWVLCGHVSSAEWCIRHGEVTRYFCQ